MELIDAKEYAKRQGVTYSAVRQQVNRYRAELEGHIVKKSGDRTEYLDEVAVRFLSDRRKASAAAVVVHDRSEELERLRKENAELKDKLFEAVKKIAEIQGDQTTTQAKLIDLQNTVIAIQDKARDSYTKLAEETARANGLQFDLEKAQAEIETYEPFLFGLYRKKPKRIEGKNGDTL